MYAVCCCCWTVQLQFRFYPTGGGQAFGVDEVAQARWEEATRSTIQVITKPCPKCRTPTERDGEYRQRLQAARPKLRRNRDVTEQRALDPLASSMNTTVPRFVLSERHVQVSSILVGGRSAGW